MPNIIEQQDLLKGLPDNKLAMMMQQPTGDMPPFLVAAEAQRRQSIREQFSGGPQESVVDTLTKQLAGSVPQNIQAPAQTPPQIPPPQMPPQMPPEMAGVGALPGGEGMRRGGIVQRYQSAGLVIPMVQPAGESYYQDPFGIPDMSGGDTSIIKDVLPDLGLPPIFPQWKTPEEVAAEEVAQKKIPYSYGMTTDERRYMQHAPVQEKQPRDPGAGQNDTSEENKYSATEAELRKRHEELYGANEVSDWERAQKWFDVAQAIMQPGQSKGEIFANAVSAFGRGMAGEKAAERQANIAKQKAMLDWDMAQYEQDRADRSAARAEKLAAQKLYIDQGGKGMGSYAEMIADLIKQKSDYVKTVAEQNLGQTPDLSKDPTIIGIDAEIKRLKEALYGSEASRQKALAGYGAMTGTDPSVMVWDGSALVPFGK